MSQNLIEKVQQNLGYPPLQKMDPNTDEAKNHKPVDAFPQAVLSAVLTALYRYVQSDEGAENFLRIANATDWADEIFDEHKDEAIENIADYANQAEAEVESETSVIVNETKAVVKGSLGDNATIKDVKNFFTNERNNIVAYLPPALHMGDWLNDTALDDNTNKMEGPISSLMHSIGNVFSNPVTKDETEANK
jgi:vacuolar-type H+-ATPase subunit H